MENNFKDENGKNMHNDWSISIESCTIDNNGNYNNKTYTSLVRLVAEKAVEYGLNPDDGVSISRHYDFTHKDCPKLFECENNPEWKKFIEDVKTVIEELKK